MGRRNAVVASVNGMGWEFSHRFPTWQKGLMPTWPSGRPGYSKI
jgi:hypothetical protein